MDQLSDHQALLLHPRKWAYNPVTGKITYNQLLIQYGGSKVPFIKIQKLVQS